MELYSFQNVNFTYPYSQYRALCNLNFSLDAGEFVLLCGPSGCGKSTLLRHLKTCLRPQGSREGTIAFAGQPLDSISTSQQAQRIGFVLQSPENQVVSDKVWHELAFGLESLGLEPATIRRRVAEIAAFFGIEHWFHQDVSALSGGQKQLLNLASVMAMQPQVLVLDEPTAQLDPIAATDFLALLGRIHRELGTTVILSEHRLEEAFPYATRVMVMDSGSILLDGSPKSVGLALKDGRSAMFYAMPTAMQVWAGVETRLECPITVLDGTRFLAQRCQEQPLSPLPPAPETAWGETALEGKGLWFRYEKDSPDVVKGLDIQIRKGQLFALMGGNGAGKTTALRLLASLARPYRGQVRVHGRIGFLPQNPQTLFVKDSLRADLMEVLGENSKEAQLRQVVNLCGLAQVLDRHPYDLSGGEQQRAALAKVLLTRPDILLLDEPTKGLDAQFQRTFAAILKNLCAQGIAVLMVSHDVAFCARYAHSCALFFDGSIVAQASPREFFCGSAFYTTPANRMARQYAPQAVTVEDVIALCGGTVPQEPEQPLPGTPLPPAPQPQSKKNPLPWWRRVLAVFFGIACLCLGVSCARAANVATLFSGGDVNTLGYRQLLLYGLLAVSALGFLMCISRRSPEKPLAAPAKERLRLRTIAACTAILLLIPVTIYIGLIPLQGKHANLIAIAILVEAMLPFALAFEGRKPQARELVTIAVLCALGVAGRGAFSMLPQFKPVLALTILTGVALGAETGFLVGAITMLASNMLFSQGPWTPWQMFAMGAVGFLAGLVFRKGLFSRSPLVLSVFGGFSALVVYGGIMNFSSAVTWNSQSLSWPILAGYYLTGLPMDLVHSAATALFLALLTKPMLTKLERIQAKYGMIS